MIVLYILPSLNIESNYSILGKWEGNNINNKFIFYQDGTCLITFFDTLSKSTNNISGNYKADYSKQRSKK